jgi:hypothetical protein
MMSCERRPGGRHLGGMLVEGQARPPFVDGLVVR